MLCSDARARVFAAVTVALSGTTSIALALDVVAPGTLPGGTVLPHGSTITGSGTLSSPSSITLGTSPSDRITASVSGYPSLDVSAGLTGPGGLIKDGPGWMTLGGTVNDYAGPTLINAGYLYLTAAVDQTFAGEILGTGTVGASGMAATIVRFTGDASTFTGSFYAGGYASTVLAGPTNPAGVNLAGDGRYFFNGRTVAVSTSTPSLSGGIIVHGGGMNGNVASTNVVLSGTATNVGAIYGGGRGGDVSGNTNVSVTAGATVKNVVYGGGGVLGDDVGGNTTVLISGSGMSLTEVRGGGINGTRVSGDTSVTVADGVRVGTVYGAGGLGAANTNVVLRGTGTAVDYVYGGGGTVTGNTTVRIEDGAVIYQKAYGAGGIVEGDSSITFSGGARAFGNVFGGVTSNLTVRNSTVNVQGAGTTITTVYGGSDGGINLGLASVNVSGGAQVTDTLFGGGLNFPSDCTGTRVSLSGVGTWANVAYGGGRRDTVAGDSIVTLSDGATVGTLYGAGMGNSVVTWDGTVQNATITLSGSGSTAGSLYGGGKWGTTTGTATINLLDSATVTTVLSGKSEVQVGTPGQKILNLGIADAPGQRYHGTISASISGFDRVSVASGSEARLNGTVASTAGRIDVYGELGGTGTLAAPITIYASGCISPGNSPGNMTLNGALSLTSGAIIEMEAGDVLVLNGSVSGLSNATLDLLATQGTFTVGQLFSGQYAPTSFDAFASVIANGGLNGVTFSADHTSVTIAVPEPGTVMLGLGVSVGALSLRKRRR